MTITSNLFIAAAQPARSPGVFAQVSGSHASYGVAWFLAAALALAPLAAGAWIGGSTAKATPTPSSGAQPVITDSPRPAYILRLERDPFR